MPNDLSKIEKLVLKGYFERSERSKHKEIEEIKKLNGELSTEVKKIIDFKNQTFDFEVQILDFDLNSGTFIARGDDIFGESVIYGKIGDRDYGIFKQRRTEFKKIYFGDPKHNFPVQRASSLNYIGLMDIFEEKIYCNGIWETHKNSPENGIWVLNQIIL